MAVRPTLILVSLFALSPLFVVAKEEKKSEEDDAMLASWRQLKRSVRGLKKDLKGELKALKGDKKALSQSTTEVQNALRVYQDHLHPPLPLVLADPSDFLTQGERDGSPASGAMIFLGKKPSLRFEEILKSRGKDVSDRERLGKILRNFQPETAE